MLVEGDFGAVFAPSVRCRGLGGVVEGDFDGAVEVADDVALRVGDGACQAWASQGGDDNLLFAVGCDSVDGLELDKVVGHDEFEGGVADEYVAQAVGVACGTALFVADVIFGQTVYVAHAPYQSVAVSRA